MVTAAAEQTMDVMLGEAGNAKEPILDYMNKLAEEQRRWHGLAASDDMIESARGSKGDAREVKPKSANDNSEGWLGDWQRIGYDDSNAAKAWRQKSKPRSLDLSAPVSLMERDSRRSRWWMI
jgi:hypothetical protein